MGGFFGVAAKDDCVEIRDLTDPYTISRMLHLEQSSTKICRT